MDIGANVGSKTELFRSHATRVVAVEPDPEIAKRLRRRFFWRPEVIVKTVAVSDQPGVIEFFKFRGNEAYNTASSVWALAMTSADNHMRIKLAEPEQINVPCTTLAILVGQFRPVSYIKIDAEGLEYEILSTLQRAVPLISLEFNLPHFMVSLQNSIKTLSSLDDAIRFNVSLTEPPLRLEFRHWLSGEELLDRVKKNRWAYIELFARLAATDENGSQVVR